tara:strand:+ start:1820 stop:2437 length:618 start_codon:yes stop_codon:yes gene_type:complete
MEKKKYFLKIFRKAEKKYGKIDKRLAGEGWGDAWKTLIATIMSAQSRDEMTIRVAEELFERYNTLKKLASAEYGDVLKVLKSMNYNKTKAKHVIACASMLISDFHGEVPDSIEELVKLPGVGRKTANLIVTEVHGLEGITVDTHVHRISNVFGIVETKNANETERELRKIVPRKYWYRVNRLFVLWGKEVPGKNKEKLLRKLEEK